MSFSPQLVYFLDRLSGFSTNIFRLEPQGSPNSGPNSITRITLPSNALLNTRSFKLHFLATLDEAKSVGGRLPADISTLVERVEISAGGVQLSQGTNFYNTLVNAKAALMGSRCDSVTGHSEMVRSNKFDGTTVEAANGKDELYTGAGTPHVIDKWEGFLGTCEPRILDASILPDLVVSIYWAPNNVLASCKGSTTSALFTAVPDGSAGAAEYKISNIHASIETVALADSVYDNMVAGMIASKGFVEIPFKQYFSFHDTHKGSSRFTIATQSLDRIWMAWRASSYNDVNQAPHAIPGYSTAAGVDSSSDDITALLSAYGGVHGTGATEKYITEYQRFKEPGAVDALKYQLQLNGAMYPQFMAGTEDMYQITKNSLPGPVKYGLTKEQLRDSYFVQCVRLNMPDSEMTRQLSGLDTRSVSLNGYVNTTGTLTADANLMIFAECSSSLRVGAGRQLEVVI
jgi:hypothetical protein